MTVPMRQAALQLLIKKKKKIANAKPTKLKLRTLYKILNSFKKKRVKMQYTSAKRMGQMTIFQEKEEFNT